MTGSQSPQALLRLLDGWLDGTHIALLELTSGGEVLRLRRTPQAVMAAPAANVTAPVVIEAPSLGVFLHRHPQRDASLALPGQAVRSGDTLGLLRIGPLLMPVIAPHDGTLIEALAGDGDTVGYGAPLFHLAEHGEP